MPSSYLGHSNRFMIVRRACWLAGMALFLGCGRDLEERSTQQTSAAVATTTPVAQATRLVEQGQSAAALKVVSKVLIETPDDTRAIELAAQIHQSLGQTCEAAALWVQLADAKPQASPASLVQAFDLYLRCGDFAAAESCLRRAIEGGPTNPIPRRLLAQMLNAQGRRYEASEQVLELIRLRVIQPDELFSLVDLSGPFSLVSYDGIVDASQTSPFSLGEARFLYIARHRDANEVLEKIQSIVEKYPENTAASAFQGRLLAASDQRDRFIAWHRDRPPGTEQHPEYWNAVGHYLAFGDRHREAIRALAEAIRLDPTDRSSMRTMITSLEHIGDETTAIQLREKLGVLDDIFHTARKADTERAQWISERLGELARPWESAAWLMYSAQLAGTLPQRIAELSRRGNAIAAWESKATIDQIREATLKKILGFDANTFPVAELEHDSSSPSTARTAPRRRATAPMRLEDVAADTGLVTRLVSGFPVDGGGFYAHQVNGAGLAVLDYDLDGSSDVYVVQSGGKPNDPADSIANQLFRLQGDNRFVEVTRETASGDRSLGQGVCAGDVNQDGFMDLLIANIGANVLLVNQGDGTFRDASERLIDNPDRWTSCLGLADLDGDQLPEIIEVNYINDPLAFEVKCEDDHLPCQPQRFISAADQLHRGTADGTFVPWSATGSFDQKAKFGFGLVIANFDHQFGNDFFVANDGNMNHFWTSVAATDAASGSSTRKYDVIESASARGCGIGRGGESQACMGVASGDFNRDGTLDLHVTNFTSESVNLYLQTQSGFFTDEALKYGLHEPSYDVLGFGTQSGDFDNDGWLDLAVVNGHVYDARKHNTAYQMKPQLFAGDSSGFMPVDPAAAGAYWDTHRLGRTLAMLDFNRDGRLDLLANHLDEPIALLQNESPPRQWIELELVGVTSERDAVGAEVRVIAGSETFTAWQMGGDGYMCTNEPMVHFGLGDIERIDTVEIIWPSGHIDRFEQVAPRARYLAIEGAGTLDLRFRSADIAD